MVLHITSGTSANEALEAAGIAGEKLSWDDVLHEGPVPSGRDLVDTSRVRAEFLGGWAWSDKNEVMERFRKRDDIFLNYRGTGKVILWSALDLYDQVQLLQLLHLFSLDPEPITNLDVIFCDRPLVYQTKHELRRSWQSSQAVTVSQLQLGARAWAAFVHPNPTNLAAMMAEDTCELPYFGRALGRLLEEFPNVKTGLSRTEQQTLEMVSEGRTNPVSCFLALRKTDDIAFMGDWSFWRLLGNLINGSCPLILMDDGKPFQFPKGHPDPQFKARGFQLTDAGREVLAGDRDWLQSQSADRWIGGVHFRGSRVWRWDPVQRISVFA